MTFYNMVILTFRNGFGYGSRWVHIFMLPVMYPCFEIGENSNSNSIKAEKDRQIKINLDKKKTVKSR